MHRFTPSAVVFTAMSAAALLPAALHPTSAHADLPASLAAVPADAQIVLYVPDLDAAREQAESFIDAAGLETYAGAWLHQFDRNLLEAQLPYLATEGVDDDGALTIAWRMIDNDPSGDNQIDMLLALPLDDADAFADAMGQPGISYTLSADHALISALGFSDGAMLKDMLDAGTLADSMPENLSETAADKLNDTPLSILINTPAISAEIMPQFNAWIDEQTAMLHRTASGEPSPSGQAMLDVIDASVTTLLEHTRGGMIRFDASDDGLTMFVDLAVDPDSPLGDALPDVNQTGGSTALLAQLPEQPFILAMAADLSAPGVQSGLQTLAQALPQDIDDTQRPALTMLRDGLNVMAASEGMAMSFYAPSMMHLVAGQGFRSAWVIKTDDTEQAREWLHDLVLVGDGMLVPMNPIFGMLGYAVEGDPQYPMVTAYERGSITVAEQPVDSFRRTLVLPEDLKAQFGSMQNLVRNFTEVNGFIADTGQGSLLLTTVPDRVLLGSAIRNSAGPQGLGHAGDLQRFRAAHLPENLALEMYVSIQGLMGTLIPILPMMDGPTLDPADYRDLRPMALGMGLPETGHIQYRLFLPSETVKATLDIFRAQDQPAQENPF